MHNTGKTGYMRGLTTPTNQDDSILLPLFSDIFEGSLNYRRILFFMDLFILETILPFQ